jgi:hypothetical protein
VTVLGPVRLGVVAGVATPEEAGHQAARAMPSRRDQRQRAAVHRRLHESHGRSRPAGGEPGPLVR